MRKFFVVFCFSLLMAVMFAGHTTYAASKSPSLYLNGAKLNPPQPPTIVGGTTFVPVRVITESLGYRVGYDHATREISIEQDNRKLILHLGSAEALIGGKKHQMPSKPLVVNGYSLLPIRFISEQFGVQVAWDAKKYAVFLTGKVKTDPVVNPPAPPVVSPPVVSPPVVSEKSVMDGFVMTADDTFTLSYSGGDAAYATSYLQNPNRIVVDVPNAALTDGFNGSVNAMDPATFAGTIDISHPIVERIRFSLFDEKTSTVRFVFDLSGPATVSAVPNKDAKRIDFKITASKTVPPTDASRKYKVVIDAGHGGSDPGAVSGNGKFEKTFTLAIATKVQALLAKEGNIEVIMTRTGDTYPTLTDRTNLAKNVKADAFVSIHANAGTSSANGFEVFYLHDNSKELAKILHDNIQSAVGFTDRGIKTASFHVIREVSMPSVLLEMGFITNPAEEKKLFTESIQQTMAEAIALSIKQFFKL